MQSPDDEAIGYKCPPKHTQFAKGTSGNPKGRPKGHKNTTSIIREVANERMVISENGKQRSITKRELLIRQLFNTAAKGNLGAFKQLLPLLLEMEAQQAANQQHSSFALTPDRLAALRQKMQLTTSTLIPTEGDTHE